MNVLLIAKARYYPNFEFFLKNEKEFNEYKKTLKIDDEIYFNNQNSVPQKCIVFSKLKNKVKCKIADNSNTIWTIPYNFLIRKKKTKTPNPTLSPKKTKIKFVVKKKTKQETNVKIINSTNSNNNKPIQITKKNSVSLKTNSNNNKPLDLQKKQKLENKTKKVVFDGPHNNKYLAGLPKDYTKTFGKGKVKDMEEIKRRCEELGKECLGFTLKNNNFSPRKGNVLKHSPSGEKSWLKK